MFLPYRRELKPLSRKLRNQSTLSEAILWKRLKRRQLLGHQFLRQKPIGRFIVDFFCPRKSLVIEIDGKSHEGRERQDRQRQDYLESQGLTVLRFGDGAVKRNIEGVVGRICQVLQSREGEDQNPPVPL